MTQHKKEDMQRINYKSDFDFILKLRDCKGDAVGFPGYDWEARLWTPQNKANAYTASCRGGVCENCYNDNGEIHIVCDGHRLGLGQLCAELTVELPNGIYPDGYRKRVEPQLLDIELVNDAGDSPTEAQTEVAVAYAVIDAYDMAVASGYEGTREEYTASLGMLPDLAATVSDLRQGKREIAEALTEQGIPTAADAPMAEMAESVRTLYQIPDTSAGAREHVTARGVYSRYDMVAEVNRHRRADYPHCIGVSFVGDTVTLGAADAYALSDGTWLSESGAKHEFTDGERAHYAVCYFHEDFFAMPWPQGVDVLDIACLGSHPTFSASTCRPFVSLFVDSAPASYEGHDFSVGSHGASVVMSGVEHLPSGEAVISDGSIHVLEMPDLVECRRTIASNCKVLRRMELPMLEKAASIAVGLQSLTELSLPSLVTATGTVASDCPALTELSLSNLEDAFSADAFGKLDNVVALSLPKLKRLYVGSSSLRLPKITSLTLPSVEYIFFGNGFLTMNMPNLNELRLPSAVTITGNGGLLRGVRDIDVYLPKVITFATGITRNNKNVRIHFGSQTGVSFDLNNAAVTAITIEPGFTGSIDFKSAVLTADNLRELLVNLGDNTDGATMRIQMGANNLAKLTEDEIAVATAKNYTVS